MGVDVATLSREADENVEAANANIAQLAASVSAQSQAWQLLLRHLAEQGLVNLESMQRDLEALSEDAADALLQDEIYVLAGSVQVLRKLGPSAR